ncbi:MAG: sugar phosphate isomerase/epimerase family protein [Planctomycetaceae bacterium]
MKNIAISQLTTLRWDIHQEVAAASKRGFGGIGMWRPKVSDLGLQTTCELLFENRLVPSSLSWAGGFTGSDGRSFSDAVEDAIDAVHDAAVLGADTLVVIAGGRNNHIRRHLHNTFCGALREIGSVAMAHDIRLAIEPFHPGCGDEWSFLGDIRTTLDILAAVGNDHVGMVLDTYHLGFEDDIDQWLPEVIPHLQLVQLGDAHHSPLGEMNRCLLGEGNVPIPAILETLAAAGYDRWIEVELLGADVEPLEYETVLDHSLAYLSRFDDLVVGS